jgi:hypothetical protein
MPVKIEEASPPFEKAARKPRQWWRSRPVLLISIGAHLLFGLGATYLVVSKYSTARKLTFQAGPKSPNPVERVLQHKVQMGQKNRTAPPAVPKRVLTTGVSKIELPAMPSMSGEHPGPPAPKMAAAGGAGFRPPGAGRGSLGGTGTGAPINFFGIRDKSSSVVIMIDVSDSMFSRTGDAESGRLVKHGQEQSFQTVRDEAIKLIESLNPNVDFGIVRWSGGAYSWKSELVAATDENKKAAIAHVQEEIDMKTARPKKGRPGGTRHDYALEEAFLLKPETIYMITDGNATAASPGGGGVKAIPPAELFKITDAGQKALTKRARLHIIYYLNGKERIEEKQMLMSLAARNNGQFRQVTAPGRKG